jgi:pimeloyl-ACP methyl ester carboxylesterase
MDAVRKLDVPTLIIGGSRDQMTGPKAGAALAKEVPGAQFVLLDAGHSVMSEAPRPTLAALTRFLDPSRLH